MKARKVIANLSAVYEAIRLAALYLIVFTIFPGEFRTGIGPIFLAAALPALALIAMLAAAGVYDALWRPLFLAFRLYKGLSIPVWGLVILTMLTSPLLERSALLAIAALGIVDVSSFLLSFLAPREEETGSDPPDRTDRPEYEETEV